MSSGKEEKDGGFCSSGREVVRTDDNTLGNHHNTGLSLLIVTLNERTANLRGNHIFVSQFNTLRNITLLNIFLLQYLCTYSDLLLDRIEISLQRISILTLFIYRRFNNFIS